MPELTVATRVAHCAKPGGRGEGHPGRRDANSDRGRRRTDRRTSRKEVLRWVRHGPSGGIFEAYATLPLSAPCEAFECLKVGVKEGKVVSIRAALEALNPLAVGDGLETEASGAEAEKERAASTVACGP
jgi:hypothetical protein